MPRTDAMYTAIVGASSQARPARNRATQEVEITDGDERTDGQDRQKGAAHATAHDQTLE